MKDYYDVKAVSNSSLSWLKDGSPKYFKMKFDGLIEEPFKSYFEKGKQIHMYILEPEEFDKEYTFLSYSKPKSAQQKEFCDSFARLKKGKKEEKLVQAYKKAYTTKESDDKVLEKAKTLEKQYTEYIKFVKISPIQKVLPSSMLGQLNESKVNLRAHTKARELLFNDEYDVFGDSDKLFIQNEFSIYWVYPNGLKCKSMLDRLVIDYENKKVQLVDLKTSAHLYSFKEKVREYSYHRQLAFYWMAVHWYFKNTLKISLDDWKKETYIVTIGTFIPYEVKVFEVIDATLNEGAIEIMSLMDSLKWHFDNDMWDFDMKYYDNILVEKI
jgi:hypothetical protein